VPGTGFEPAHLAAPPPEDGASTNFATRAEGEKNMEYRTRNFEFRRKIEVGSTFNIPCSTFDIQKLLGGANIWHQAKIQTYPYFQKIYKEILYRPGKSVELVLGS
jgi:hypothetical protein